MRSLGESLLAMVRHPLGIHDPVVMVSVGDDGTVIEDEVCWWCLKAMPIPPLALTRAELAAAFTFWMIEAEHGDFRPVEISPEEYGPVAADHLIRIVDLVREVG